MKYSVYFDDKTDSEIDLPDRPTIEDVGEALEQAGLLDDDSGDVDIAELETSDDKDAPLAYQIFDESGDEILLLCPEGIEPGDLPEDDDDGPGGEEISHADDLESRIVEGEFEEIR